VSQTWQPYRCVISKCVDFKVHGLQAAVLHDTVEDTDTTLDEIEASFGVEVRRIVDEVTDDKSLPKAERKRLQVVFNCLQLSYLW